MSMIYIADHQEDDILDFITEEEFWGDNHHKSLLDNQETFDFVTFADKSYSQYLEKMNRIIIQDEDGDWVELYIRNTRKDHDGDAVFTEVYTSATYVKLKTAKQMAPHRTEALSAEAHAIRALNGTEWTIGTVDFKGVRTFTFDDYVNPYDYLRRIASEFDLELRFRVETDGNKITKRYVDIVEYVGTWDGKEVEFEKDLIRIERKEDFSNVVTALIGLGPEDEEGNRLSVLVEDEEALQRWGRNGQHIIGIYEPESTDTSMTLERLTTLTENELEKRINSKIQYLANVVDLERVIGLEHEKLRFGDVIRIKDLKFNPPLYLEARVHTVDRSIKPRGHKTVTLGDFTEYTEEDVHALVKDLRRQLRNKIGLGDLEELTYTKPEIDEKDERGNQAADKIETDVGWVTPIESTTGAQEKANQAKDDAIEYTDGIKQQIDTELLEKTDYEYVDGKLSLKADSDTVQAINSTVEGLEQTTGDLLQSVADNLDALEAQGGRITKVETDLDEVEGQLSVALTDLSAIDDEVSRQRTQINANTEAIGFKADKSELDTLSGDISDISGELTVLAGEVSAKAERSELETLEGNVTSISNDLASLSVAYDGITADISSLETTTDGLTTDISNLNTEIQAVAGEVSTKVSAEYVTGAIADIEIGGRNLVLGTSDSFRTVTISQYGYSGMLRVPIDGEKVSHGDEVTFSVYVKDIPNGEEVRLRLDWYRDDGTYSSVNAPVSQYTNKDGRLTFTAKVSSDTTFKEIRGRIMPKNWSSNYQIKIKEEQLEKGNKATDWSPAPEDVQAEIDSVYSYASSEISQLSGRINLKADATTVSGLSNRVTSAELAIDGLEGQISSKVEANDVRSIFLQEAGAFTFSADQINFDGHVFGQNATFEGRIEGAEIVGSTFNQSGSKGSITLDQEGLKIRDASNSLRMILSTTNGSYQSFSPSSIIFEPNDNFYELVAGTGLSGLGDGFFGFKNSAPNRTLNMLNEGDGSAIQFFSPAVNIGGDLVIGGGLAGQGRVSRLEFNANRSDTSGIRWNATSTADYGLIIKHEGTDVVKIDSNGIELLTGTTYTTSSFEATRGHVFLRPANSSSEARVATSSGSYRPIRAASFPTGSLARFKTNITEWEGSGIDIINRSTIYEYRLKDDPEILRYGLVIGEGYNTPSEVIDGDGVEQYLMNSISWKAIQEITQILLDKGIIDEKDIKL